MKLTFLCAVCCLCLTVGCSSAKTDTRLVHQLDGILHKLDDKGVVFASRVVDLETGRELYAHRIDEPMIPASNMKLFTTAAGLATLGAEYQFETYLVLHGNDLLIIGGGDPATGDPNLAKKRDESITAMFDRWADALKQRGIHRVDGKLFYFDGAFDRQSTHPSWSKDFYSEWYAAPVSGLNFNDNCVDITAEPTATSQPATLTVIPPASSITVHNQTQTTETGNPTITREREANVFTVAGDVSKKHELDSTPVTDPGSFFADVFRTHLQNAGIEIVGETVRLETLPENEPVELIAVHRTTMADILARVNKNSQNLFAEALAKALGKAATGKPGSWEDGEAATNAFLKSLNIDIAGFKMADGSGLSRQNRVTARAVTDLLVAMSKRADGEFYRASLSRAGEDGTISKRMTDLKGHVKAKTGYINGVRALSGYIQTRKGKTLVFSLIYNQIPGSVKPVEELQDEFCRTLVGQVR